MATMQEKMAESLAALKAYQDAHGDNLVIHGAEVLGRTHTERLVDAGYLTMVLRGWYIPSFPGNEGDSIINAYNLEIRNSRFIDNPAKYAISDHATIVDNCEFTNNIIAIHTTTYD